MKRKKEQKIEFEPIDTIAFAETIKKSLKEDQKLLRALAFENASLLNKPISKRERREYCEKVDKMIDNEIAKLKKAKK